MDNLFVVELGNQYESCKDAYHGHHAPITAKTMMAVIGVKPITARAVMAVKGVKPGTALLTERFFPVRNRRYQQDKEQKSLVEGIIKICNESTNRLGFY